MTDSDIRTAALNLAKGGDCTPILATWVMLLLEERDPLDQTRRFVRARIAEGLQQAKVEA